MHGRMEALVNMYLPGFIAWPIHILSVVASVVAFAVVSTVVCLFTPPDVYDKFVVWRSTQWKL
jgi:hypothetical protein